MECPTCNGSGMVAYGPWGSRPPRKTCEDCGGSGKAPEYRPVCPEHGIPDCSPLLNGCSRVIQMHAEYERTGEKWMPGIDWLVPPPAAYRPEPETRQKR